MFTNTEVVELVKTFGNGQVCDHFVEEGRAEMRKSWSTYVWAALLTTENFTVDNLRMLTSLDKHGVLAATSVYQVLETINSWRSEMKARYVGNMFFKSIISLTL